MSRIFTRRSLNRLSIMLFLLFVLIIGAHAADDPGKLIGIDTYASFIIRSPQKLMNSVDEFIKFSNFSMLLPEGSKSFLSSIFQENYSVVTEEIDFQQSVLINFVPGFEKKIGVQLWLPVKNKQKSLEAIMEGNTIEYPATLINNYAVLCYKCDLIKKLPSKVVKSSFISLQPEDSLAIWVNLEKGRSDFGDKFWDQFENSFLSKSTEKRWYDEEDYYPESEYEDSEVEGLLKGFENISKDILSFGILVRVNAEGISLAGSCETKNKGTLHDFSMPFSTMKPGLPYIKYLESGKLLSIVGNLPSETVANLQAVYKTLFPSLFKEKISPLMEDAKQFSSLIGPNQAVFFDLFIDPGLMLAMGTASTQKEQIALFDKYLKLDVFSIYESKNWQKYRAEYFPYLKKSLSYTYMQEPLSALGIIFDPQINQSAISGIQFDEIQLNVNLDTNKYDEMDEETRPLVKMALDLINAKTKISQAYMDGKIFSGFMNPEDLIAVAKRNGAINPLESSRSFAEFSKIMPSDTRAVMSLSLNRLAKLISVFAPQYFNGIDIDALGDTYFWFGASRDNLSTGIWLSSSDIAKLSGFIMPLLYNQAPSEDMLYESDDFYFDEDYEY